ncbi:hypothetical protein BDV93DRAFT_520277 [Ceratobasidium sp. AG-I]|nr:hypothetical protein BDV93DRAFT_520277 [Ceratobasidium sp. AG-I]
MPLIQIAPVNKLPPELLSSVFIYLAKPNNTWPTRIKVEGLADYSTVVSSVCVCWRRIAIGTPCLWSDIRVMREDDTVRDIEPINLWLKRSRNSPLRVLVRNPVGLSRHHTSEDLVYFKGIALNRIISVLCSCAPHLHSFTLECFGYSFDEQILSVLSSKGANSCIQELFLGRNLGKPGFLTLFAPSRKMSQLLAPLLVLHLEYLDVNLDYIPCQNLVDLRLIGISTRTSETKLARFCALNLGLQSFVLHKVRITPPVHAQPIHLPALRILDLSLNIACLDWFLRLLVPPSHEVSLYLGGKTGGDIALAAFDSTLTSFLQRAQVKLLSIFSMTSGCQPVSLLPKPMPQLQHLRLDLKYLDPAALAREFPASHLPKLHTVDLINLHARSDLNLDSGLGVLLSLPSVGRITYRMCGKCAAEGTEWVDEILLRRGVNAKIRYDPELALGSFDPLQFNNIVERASRCT